MTIEAKEERPQNMEEKLKDVCLKLGRVKESPKMVGNGDEIITDGKLNLIKIETMNNIKRSNKTFSCTICIYKADHKSHFDSHMLRKHSEREERLVCTRPWCKETFSTKHEREEHKKICLLECGVCGKKLDRQDHLDAHMRAEANKTLKVAAQRKWESYAL